MSKAFIFDMDGVLVDSEPSWVEVEREFLPQFFGKEVFDKMPNLVGAGLESVLESATSFGAKFERAKALEMYEEIARQVYLRSPITTGVDTLVNRLLERDFRIGLVTQSPYTWIDQVVPRLPFKENLEAVVSMQDRPDLKRKPAPDGFIEAFRTLSATPANSFILEDSNLGIESGKAAGAYVIGFRGNLVDGYEQTGADAYADTMDDVITLVESFDSSS